MVGWVFVSLVTNDLLMLLSSPPLRLFYVPKALKDPDQVAQSDGEESPAAGEQLLGEVLIFIILDNCMIIVYLT